MRIGIYFDMRNPKRWYRPPERLYGFALEMCEEAEHLGADSVWLTEHHLFDDGYLPQPLTFAASIAARTKRLRIGVAVIVAPLHKPVEIAEQCAIVDIVSGGRLEIGLGAGYRRSEYDLYDVPMERRYAATDRMARELRRLWSDGGITPRPLQERLPIWMGYLGPRGAVRAAELGEHLLSPSKERWPPYRDAWLAAGRPISAARMGGALQAFVTEDPDADWLAAAPHVAYMYDSYRRHMIDDPGAPAPSPVDLDRLRNNRSPRHSLDYLFFGTPADVATQVRDYVGDAPVDTLYFWASLGGMGEDMVAEHIRTICTRLAPALGAS